MGDKVFEWFFKGWLNYIKSTQEENALYVFLDSDYAHGVVTRKSLLGFVFTLFGTILSWKENQHSMVALPTT